MSAGGAALIAALSTSGGATGALPTFAGEEDDQ